MGNVLHPRATTTHRIRAEIQQSEKTVVEIAKQYGINRKTVRKWKNRDSVEDMPMGKREVKSTVLTSLEEEAIVKFRQLTQLPIDDVLLALRDSIPKLTRSNLYRCLKRHGLARLPEPEEKVSKKKQFKTYEIGYFHIDTAEVRTDEGKAYLFVAIDRTSKFVVARLYKDKTRATSTEFLKHVIETVPYVIHTILTDNGIEYTDIATHRKVTGHHPFDRICVQYNIEHRLTKIKHPWTNGQVERMNRTLKEATVKKYHYHSFEALQTHLQSFVSAYNCAKHLKSLNLKTPLEFLVDVFLNKPVLFKYNPHLYYTKLNS